MKRYSIQETSKITGIKAHTLRYYESIGLIEPIEKNSSGRRSYSEKDLEWIEFLKKAKATGMKISKILEYIELRKAGEDTAQKRKEILEEHLTTILKEIEALNEVKEYVEWKIDFYNKHILQ